MDIQLLVFLIATRYVRYALEIIFHDDNRPILKGEWKYWGARWFGWIEFHFHKWKDFKLLINKIKGYDVFFFFFWKMKIFKGGKCSWTDSSTVHEFIERLRSIEKFVNFWTGLNFWMEKWIFKGEGEDGNVQCSALDN